MPLQATSGAASYDAFGGGVAAVPTYIEDVFSTYLYTGTGASQTVTNGIDLSTKGGLVWVKSRAGSIDDHILVDTARGTSSGLRSNLTNAASGSGGFTSFNTDGFSFGSSFAVRNDPSTTYVSWTFREQPKFFDIVTWTGNGVAGRQIPHNLGSVPGCIIVKNLELGTDWIVYHRGANGGVNPEQYSGNLNTTGAFASGGEVVWGDGTTAFPPTSTYFTVYSSNALNRASNLNTYVAYVFAHNAGGFGLTGTDNVISCGSYTGTGSSTGPTVDLGYEPQWLLVKKASGSQDWFVFDNMRGVATGGNDYYLRPNSSDAETTGGDTLTFTATGFIPLGSFDLNTSGTYIYIAIRRGPMKVPTSGTSVFSPIARTGTGSQTNVGGLSFSPDLLLVKNRGNTQLNWAFDRLRGGNEPLSSNSTDDEATNTANYFGGSTVFTPNNTGFGISNAAQVNTSSGSYANWLFGRAPSFFDEVCYTNPPSSPVDQTHSHNLGVVPTLVITKGRNQTGGWIVLLDSSILGSVKYMYLNTTAAAASGLTYSATTTQYTTSFIGNYNETQVAYLFATCAGVSKVGSYTGNGTTQTIDCGFGAGGARFVLIKRTDATGGWYVYDTARGMTVLTDPYLFLNDTAAEVATLGSVTTVSTGFALNSTILAAINVSAGSYIFLAIA